MIGTIQNPAIRAHIAKREAQALAIAECIRSLGTVPSGEIYAMVMNVLPLDEYNKMIAALVKIGAIENDGHLLKWVGKIKAKSEG
jgi:hypothetical protein